MVNFFSNAGNVLDTILILIPVIVCIILVFKLVVPKKPLLGIGLAGGIGLLGYFLVKRRLRNAFAVEKKIAQHNEMINRFKIKQKTRYNAVMANKQVIATLTKQRKKLAKNAEKHETELRLIDEELKDRKTLNEQLLKSSAVFLETVEERNKERDELLERFERQSTSPEIAKFSQKGVDKNTSKIEIDGYHLLEE